MLALFIIFISVWLAYNTAIYFRYGLLTSVSASHYALIGENKNFGWIFTACTWAYALPAMVIGQTGLMFFAGGFICFVGVAANYKSGMDKIWHGRFAIFGVLLSQLSIFFDFGYWWINVGSVAAMIVLWILNHKNKTYWVEQVAMLAIILTLITRL